MTLGRGGAIPNLSVVVGALAIHGCEEVRCDGNALYIGNVLHQDFKLIAYLGFCVVPYFEEG
uniref:Uncharacterized protein n=1 Tax=Ignisphaera aggregans TaxID=334771 RepID=A0A7J2U559_9CREN